MRLDRCDLQDGIEALNYWRTRRARLPWHRRRERAEADAMVARWEERVRWALVEYARVCGETFAKGHARTSDPAVLSGYAGQADKLDRAIAKLAFVAADQVTADHELLVKAIADGAIKSADID